MAGAQAVGHHQVGQLGQHGIATDAGDRKRLVQRRTPPRTRARGIGALEAQESLERRQERGDRAAQVIERCAVVSRRPRLGVERSHAAGIWKPGVDFDRASSSGVMSVATPSNSGVDR